jgi:hypothetical protein
MGVDELVCLESEPSGPESDCAGFRLSRPSPRARRRSGDSSHAPADTPQLRERTDAASARTRVGTGAFPSRSTSGTTTAAECRRCQRRKAVSTGERSFAGRHLDFGMRPTPVIQVFQLAAPKRTSVSGTAELAKRGCGVRRGSVGRWCRVRSSGSRAGRDLPGAPCAPALDYLTSTKPAVPTRESTLAVMS